MHCENYKGYLSEKRFYVFRAASKFYAEPRLSPTRHIDATDSNWVTVFGYPLSAASFILAQLSHCGNIIATRTPTKGNWMHIKYSSKLEARRALANNGKVFAGTVMIGVIPCRDQVCYCYFSFLNFLTIMK